MKKKLHSIIIGLLLAVPTICAQPLPRVAPQQVGLDAERLLNADRVINTAISNAEIPGAVLAVVRDGKMAYLKAYGNRSIFPKSESMTINTIFDMASCSKSMSTAVCAMILVDKGYIRLQDPVSMFIPGFKDWTDADGKDKTTIRIEHLLTHSSGLPAYVSPTELSKIYSEVNSDSLIHYIANCRRDFKPTTDFQYSCLNFIAIQKIIEKVSRLSLREFAKQNIFKPLGMTHTDYLPCHFNEKSSLWVNDEKVIVTDDSLYTTSNKKAKSTTSKGYFIAPTEKQDTDRKQCFLGQVHDPLAREVNLGISGNAGVFTTAEDVAILCAALMNNGEINGNRILSPLAVKKMRTVPRAYSHLGRALGWDVYSDYSSNLGNLFSDETFGHTGYTGTSILIDPINDISVILLTNRAHPNDGGAAVRLRTLVANAVAGAIVDTNSDFSDINRASTEKYFPYYYTRFNQFIDEPSISSNDIVMLGNSLTEGGKDWGKLLGWKNVVNRGIIGDEINGIYDRLHQILPGKPKKIYYLCGINDVSHALSTEEIISRSRRVIERIQAESPTTELIIQSLLPINEDFNRYKNLAGKTAQIPEINAALEQLAKEKSVQFINLFPLFTEPNSSVLRKDLTTDGLHLNNTGYKIWANAIKKAEKQNPH